MGEDPQPYELWMQAGRETGTVGVQASSPERANRYRELLREHGHVVPLEPGENRNLPCGWPGERAEDLGVQEYGPLGGDSGEYAPAGSGLSTRGARIAQLLDHAAVVDDHSSEVVVLRRQELFEFLGLVAMPPWPPGDADCSAIAGQLVDWVEAHRL